MWQDIEGHDDVVEQFRRALRSGRLASTFLFVGLPGVGKRTFARKLAQTLLCETRPAEDLAPCGVCPACQQVVAGVHPDLILVGKPVDKSFIPVDAFIGDREHRMQSGLCHEISLKPFRGGRKIALIDDADFLNEEGANCLLKTLEEPPPQSVLILLGTSAQKQLPTIRSRSQIVRFRPLSEVLVAELLVRHQLATPEDAPRLAAFSGGSLQQALDWSDPALEAFRSRLLEVVAQPRWDAVEFFSEANEFVTDAGTEAPPRRARLTQVIGFAAEFYRNLMWSLAGAAPQGDERLRRAVAAALRVWPGDETTAAVCLERCLDAQESVLRNAHLPTLLECWLDEVSRA